MTADATFDRIDALRSPKLTELVANSLRRKILSGELPEGSHLPPEPDLVEQLGVSRPTLREALRVLESESLIRPRRGSRSGAEICAPSVDVSARYMGFVLQHGGVTIEDVLRARRIVEPPLAGILTASKSPVKITRLRDLLKEEEDALDDRVAFGQKSIRFHELVAELAGVETLTVSVRQFNWVLGRLTTTVEADLISQAGPDDGNRRAHRAHVKFVDLLEGTDDPATVQQYWQRHVDAISSRLLEVASSETVIDLFG